ncbi:MAG TPA: methylated-DNA--[protein]-cysteine S-methyltransferase [Burkholderiales bacterium]|nr:methylated-DNA--[protein]-cysteine S-methyltransferase [Burkholderiales bacterium]
MNDYGRIARAIEFIAGSIGSQPTLDEVSAHLHMSNFHFQRMFSKWAGVSPKRFLQVLTLERAKALLEESRAVLDASETVGLSSASRLYDHFVNIEAVTPGEYKSGGSGLSIEFGMHETPFGPAFIAVTPRGICNFSFAEHANTDEHFAQLSRCWPNAQILENRDGTQRIAAAMFEKEVRPDKPLSLHVSGTNFQISVWKALIRIPPGSVTSYSRVAEAIGRKKSARAVGGAVGANPVAFLIPCHRVIRECGNLGGYRWGETRKLAIQAWESARR